MKNFFKDVFSDNLLRVSDKEIEKMDCQQLLKCLDQEMTVGQGNRIVKRILQILIEDREKK